jgi:hypothetical protein
MIDKSEEALLNKVSSSPDNEKNNWQSWLN